MGRFNLIDEPWISVMTNDKGETKEVSLAETLQNAKQYKALAGDSPTQDFAVLRILLAVLHTVFSRFDAEGNAYAYFEVDDQLKQTTVIDEDNIEDYAENLYDTWIELWEKKQFPDIVQIYLEQWHERFYLFDDKYPFFQVTEEMMEPEKINKASPSSVSGKNINRLISESGNKAALFSPKYKSKKNKELLTTSEIARWLITFQGYSGLSDKVIFGEEKYKSSKGWLFDIGGTYLEGKNLYETLLLNLVLIDSQEMQLKNSQKPSWEYSGDDLINWYFSERKIDNIAELYTNWSRAIYINPEIDINKPFEFNIVKLPDIYHQNQFVEPMTTWRFNKSGENKNTYTPRKHQMNQSMWRSFGLITLPHSDTEEQRRPGVMDWLDKIDKNIEEFEVKIQAISMQDDGNATSWVPVNEIHDSLKINDLVLTDIAQAGWLPRINEVVETTKTVIGYTYRTFMEDIRDIRQLSSNHQFVSRSVEELYYAVDLPFRNWLSSLQPSDSKVEQIFKWHATLKKIVNQQAEKVLENATYRDYVGMEIDGEVENIITAYNRFKYYLNKKLEEGD
ncbi:type I-E CRISPR-associated protein Cse1/CasA [Tetragenococcus osmophilus]|uniref:CRISPR-associated protein CasA n=1 Tax=Tetragenococcus osmophilus TaxID=526944 RepID=A0AA37XJR1_9ENTE|nr:type I-E CRISPR-associated protein Cse1/CasA [Tetragenococcus osmophilus]AYW48819.1 type I-E CRISPR-associated protein Cse1/CasA [Tetragenococcus osmophilus]GMA54819.1 CRISPR-associated protein CasA [Alicyclobacillus contaminans]GMA71374.1 CRISPR-associated protein CasA [Tetragenococcus osmophilus]